jgi:uncharacterized membrane protein YtjA (UPF0391 family)
MWIAVEIVDIGSFGRTALAITREARCFVGHCFLIIALVAGLLGFTGLAMAAAGIAKILFVIFLVLFLASLVGHLFGRA